MARIPVNRGNKKDAATNSNTTEDQLLETTDAETASTQAGGSPTGNEAGSPVDEVGEAASPVQGDLQQVLEAKDTEIRRLEQQAKDANDQIMRAFADMDNIRRRGRQEREEAAQFGTQELLQDLLPVMDNLERALAAENATVEALRNGVDLTLRQMLDVLRKHGVEPVSGAGQPFDAQVHEAIMRAEPTSEFPAGTVVDEIRKGYTLRGRLLRPTLVKVAQEE